MCLITFAYQTNEDYPLVLVANRDEAYSRPSLSIQEWDAPSGIIGGRDADQGGTWLAFSKSGKFAALTNYPFVDQQVENPISRGLLISEYLDSDITAGDYLTRIRDQKNRYEGFHLLLGRIHPQLELEMYNNVDDQIINYEIGIHTISNTYDDLSAHRKNQSVEDLTQLMQGKFDLNQMISNFQNTDENPHLTYFPSFLTLDQAKKASAIFVKGEGDFGTVSTTAIVLDKYDQLTMKEVRYTKDLEEASTEIKYNFIK